MTLGARAGPWWLVTDDPKALFRLWSFPVHRWLHSCIYRPVLDFAPRSCSTTKNGDGSNGIINNDAWIGGKRSKLAAVLAVFSVSSLFHEAILFVGMRKTCWPFQTVCLIWCAVHINRWDCSYPVLSYISESDGGGADAATPPSSTARALLANRQAKLGSEWRGWGAVVFYMVTSAPFPVVLEVLAWQWWRLVMR